MNFWSIQILNGLSLAMLLFLLSAGLSIIFGLMRVINLAHGSFYLLGGYIGLTVIGATGNFWLALLIAPLAVGVLSAVIHGALLQRVQHNELAQVLAYVRSAVDDLGFDRLDLGRIAAHAAAPGIS